MLLYDNFEKTYDCICLLILNYAYKFGLFFMKSKRESIYVYCWKKKKMLKSNFNNYKAVRIHKCN